MAGAVHHIPLAVAIVAVSCGVVALCLALAVLVPRHGGRHKRRRWRPAGRHATPSLWVQGRELAVAKADAKAEAAEQAAADAEAAGPELDHLVPLELADPPVLSRPDGRHRRVIYGPPADCPDPARCGMSPACLGGACCLDPAPVNVLGRVVPSPGRMAAAGEPKGRHHRPPSAA